MRLKTRRITCVPIQRAVPDVQAREWLMLHPFHTQHSPLRHSYHISMASLPPGLRYHVCRRLATRSRLSPSLCIGPHPCEVITTRPVHQIKLLHLIARPEGKPQHKDYKSQSTCGPSLVLVMVPAVQEYKSIRTTGIVLAIRPQGNDCPPQRRRLKTGEAFP